MVERRRRGPRPAEDVDVLGLSRVAFGLAQPVALAGLLVVVPARDEVHHRASTAELVEGGQLFGRDRRVDGVGPQRDDRPEPLGELCDGRGEGERVLEGGVVGHQCVVEAAVLQGPRVTPEEGHINGRETEPVELVGRIDVYAADEFDGHDGPPDAPDGWLIGAVDAATTRGSSARFRAGRRRPATVRGTARPRPRLSGGWRR